MTAILHLSSEQREPVFLPFFPPLPKPPKKPVTMHVEHTPLLSFGHLPPPGVFPSLPPPLPFQKRNPPQFSVLPDIDSSRHLVGDYGPLPEPPQPLQICNLYTNMSYVSSDAPVTLNQGFVAKEDEEVSVSEKEMVVILNDKLPKYWLVKKGNGQTGLILATCFGSGRWGRKVGEWFWAKETPQDSGFGF